MHLSHRCKQLPVSVSRASRRLHQCSECSYLGRSSLSQSIMLHIPPESRSSPASEEQTLMIESRA
ncbi:hypothetical protein T265_11608 [Opisthorchis viverrini]|uniref:Uncharacterized protein n=1 Tax=Opisthorchis viverrini TaxID=6198 RepID=A0A074ZX05_OPIVI|nr:hypothetical protein T265_11608 [Opisthorchis viverrini]KER19679.1 hypothetical protein T265_11608 [Opisthorchis viverrini]